MVDETAPRAARLGHGDLRILAGLLAGTSVVTVDFFAVLAALPLLQQRLGASPGELQLIVAGYAVITACFLIIGGRLGDAWGRQRVFMAGLMLFCVGAIGGALAGSVSVIIGMRLVQGLGGALLQPQVLGLLTVHFDASQRARVFGIYTTTLAASAVASQLISGALVQWLPGQLAWRLCFVLSVPLCLMAAWLTARLEDDPSERSPRIDLMGSLILACALGSLSAALTLGRDQNWPAWSGYSVAGGLVCLALMVLWQRSAGSAGGPVAPRLIPPGLLGLNRFTLAVGGVMLFYAGVSSFYLVFALSLRASGQFSPAAIGMVFGLMAVAVAGTSAATRENAGARERWLGQGVILLALGHLVWLEAMYQEEALAQVIGVLVAALLQGSGLGLLMGRLMANAVSQLKPHQASVGSGVASTMQQVGNSLGVLLIGLAYFDDAGQGRDLAAAVGYLVVTLAGLWVMVRAAHWMHARRMMPES